MDKDKALEIFKKSVALGNPEGNAYIAQIYEEKGDYEKAFEWASKGAKLNNIKSIAVLGYLYLNGKYVKRDLEKAKELLDTTDLPLKDIVAAVGYSNVSSFIRRFKQLYGVTPRRYAGKSGQ